MPDIPNQIAATSSARGRFWRDGGKRLSQPLSKCPVWLGLAHIPFPFPLITTSQMIEQYAMYYTVPEQLIGKEAQYKEHYD